MLTPNVTLAELATKIPAASRVFRRHGLDYCCGGRRPLEDACRERELKPRDVLDEVEREQPQPNDPSAIATLSVPELVQHILDRYHAPLRGELGELVAMATKVERVHGDKPNCPKGLAALLQEIQDAMLSHMAKEEQILFPMIAQGRPAKGPITVMLAEHDHHGGNLRRLRAIAHDFEPPAEACVTWRALYLRLTELEGEVMDHIHLENNVLFPAALSV
jgi:regulator of cell morphogenesis and NO signaling